MNILDYKAEPYVEGELWKSIFKKQNALLEKYKDIEKLPEWPMSLNIRHSQVVIKDFLWRVTEEVSESYETILDLNTQVFDPETGLELHQIEELIDGLHFFIELAILVGLDEEWAQTTAKAELNEKYLSVNEGYLMLYARLGLIGNTLKNKPWKQSFVPTDYEKFHELFTNAFIEYIRLFNTLGVDEKILWDFYSRKNQVNQFRQRSQY